MFHTGQKVAFIGGVFPDRDAIQLSNKKVYTVHSYCKNGRHGNEEGIHLNEVHNTSSSKRCSCYSAHEFRPIVEKKTDISVFTEMLKDTKIIEKV